MVEDVTKELDAIELPVTVVVGDRDQVEHEDTLKEVFARFLPQATFASCEESDTYPRWKRWMRSPTPAMLCFTTCDAGCE
jgi:hypothetical protein